MNVARKLVSDPDVVITLTAQEARALKSLCMGTDLSQGSNFGEQLATSEASLSEVREVALQLDRALDRHEIFATEHQANKKKAQS